MSLETDTQTYWRNSQSLRGHRDGYPVVAEGLLGLVAVNHAGERLGRLAEGNSVSRFKPDAGGNVVPLRNAPLRYPGGIDDIPIG